MRLFNDYCRKCESCIEQWKKDGVGLSGMQYTKETQYSLLKLIWQYCLTKHPIIKIHAVAIDYVNDVCIEG